VRCLSGAGLRGAAAPPRHRKKRKKEVSGEAIVSTWNVVKPFGGRGSAPDPAGGAYSAPQRAYSAPPDPLARGERAGCPLPKNLTPAVGPTGLASRPFGPRFRPPSANPKNAPGVSIVS